MAFATAAAAASAASLTSSLGYVPHRPLGAPQELPVLVCLDPEHPLANAPLKPPASDARMTARKQIYCNNTLITDRQKHCKTFD